MTELRKTLRLDIGCGPNLEPGWTGMDVRDLIRDKGRLIVHDIEHVPWPLEDNSCSIVQASHIMEHVSPVIYRLIFVGATMPLMPKLVKSKGFITVMDEMWRVLEHDGQAWITGPYGWSHGFIQDPTHTKPLNETLFAYFTPTIWTGEHSPLYDIYEPKPWRWVRDPEIALGGNICVILSAVKQEDEPVAQANGDGGEE